jgi:hypothetical protein
VIVLKCVPLGLAGDFLSRSYRHNHLVFVGDGKKPVAVSSTHLVQTLINVHLPFVVHDLHKSVRVRRVTDALEELDSFLSL